MRPLAMLLCAVATAGCEEPEEVARPAPDDQVEHSFPPPFYWHGNEPDVHAPYLFAQAGRPDLAHKWVRWIMSHLYSSAFDGVTGNDDAGTLSAWYVWSALGLYPLPGSDQLILGTPLFPRAEIAIAGGTLTIEAPDVSSENLYVEEVELDGEEIEGAMVRQQDLRPGVSLCFEMDDEPAR